jgi:F-type H+-transporting ATPase subunit delta
MSELTTIARPYAKAAFDFAKDKKCIDKWFDMLNFLNVVLQDNYFISVKNSLSKSKLAELLIGICSKNIDRYFENFIKILIENNRLVAMNDIVVFFHEYMDQFYKEMKAEVISAEPLSSLNINKLKKFLETKYKCKVEIVNSIDETLIGGVVIKTPNEVLDASLKNKINSLHSSLLS